MVVPIPENNLVKFSLYIYVGFRDRPRIMRLAKQAPLFLNSGIVPKLIFEVKKYICDLFHNNVIIFDTPELHTFENKMVIFF